MAISITEQEILKFHKDNPKVGYYGISKKFNLPIYEILNIFIFYQIGSVQSYNITDKFILTYNSVGKITYKEFITGEWIKREYDTNSNLIKEEYSNGDGYN